MNGGGVWESNPTNRRFRSGPADLKSVPITRSDAPPRFEGITYIRLWQGGEVRRESGIFMKKETSFEDLISLMERLRSPEGCPWDREQTLKSLGPMLIEEASEVLDAAEAGDWGELRDELGDLLFQAVFYGQIAAETGAFTIRDSISRVHEKMVRRHPHVFGEETVGSTAEVLLNWEAIKAAERQASGRDSGGSAPESMLDGVSKRLPALLEACQLTTKAARVGFDWPVIDDVFAKLEEEIRELRAEINRPDRDIEAIHGEIGDVLFVLANLARWTGTEPESALRTTNRKFRRRFAHVEQRVAETGKPWRETTLAEMDAFWDEAKRMEAAGGLHEEPAVPAPESLAEDRGREEVE